MALSMSLRRCSILALPNAIVKKMCRSLSGAWSTPGVEGLGLSRPPPFLRLPVLCSLSLYVLPTWFQTSYSARQRSLKLVSKCNRHRKDTFHLITPGPCRTQPASQAISRIQHHQMYFLGFAEEPDVMQGSAFLQRLTISWQICGILLVSTSPSHTVGASIL